MRIVHAFNVGLVKITKPRIYEYFADDLTFISIQFVLRYCISINIFSEVYYNDKSWDRGTSIGKFDY